VWEAWRIVISEMLVFSQRQATPILVGFSDSTVSVPLFDSNGNPLEDSEGNPVSISAPEAMLNQLSSIENRSVISTDVQNRIEAIVQNTGGEFFFHCLKYLQQLMFMGLLFPETIFAVSNDSGDSNLNKGHQFTLDIVLRSLQNQISEALLENPVRFLITQMHGEQDSYGEFRKPEEPLDIDGKVKILSSVFSGVSSAVLDAASPEVYDKVALLLDLDRKKNKKMSAFSNLYW
jgi:hypothetical protein